MSSPPTSWKYGDPPVGPQTPDDFVPKNLIPFVMPAEPDEPTLHVHVHREGSDAPPSRDTRPHPRR